MRRQTFLIVFLVLTVAFSAGCDEMRYRKKRYEKVKEVQEKAPVEFVTDESLAKVMLKPKPYKISVHRDPFKPLIMEEPTVQDGRPQMDVVLGDPTKGMSFQGVVKINNEFSALLHSPNEKGVYKKNDRFQGFEIVDIHDDSILLKKDDKTYKLERGEK